MGFIDLKVFHLSPEARVVRNGRNRWIAISHIEKAWGTGVFQENETFYALSDGKLSEVLSFPLEGHLSWGPVFTEIAFKATVGAEPFNGSDIINVDYLTTGGFGNGPIVRVSRKVSFVKQPSALKFEFDPTRSAVSLDEFVAVYDIASGEFSVPKFINFSRTELRQIAQGNRLSKEWLRLLLEKCDGSTQEVCPDLIKLLNQ